VTGPIKTYWTAHKSTYGDPTGNAVSVSGNGGGTTQQFTKGTLYTSAAGTFGAVGAVRSKYTALGGPAGRLGWPRKAQTVRTGAHAGTIQAFQKGTVYSSSAGTAAVLAPIAAKYLASGYELGSLGYPTSDASTGGGGTVQSFQGGRVVSIASRTIVVRGSVLSMWITRGAQGGTLGWPTSEETAVTSGGKKGTVQSFETGVVTVQGTARSVTGPLGANYLFHGGPTGALGWPKAASVKRTDGGGGWVQVFTGGRIYWGATAGVHAIANGAVLSLYNARGGTTGSLGWMELSANDRAGIGGNYAKFQNGRIYTSKVGTYAVLGAILETWIAKDGTKGVLGWPTSNARNVGGTTVQTFQHGEISWTAAGGAKASRS
jgi:uncharacterized protein with LGFP repeats